MTFKNFQLIVLVKITVWLETEPRRMGYWNSRLSYRYRLVMRGYRFLIGACFVLAGTLGSIEKLNL